MKKTIPVLAFGSVLLAGCAATYGPPEDSGLMAVRAYPMPDDVCQVIGENDLTNNFLDHTALLIGCPVAETGAIADRVAEGAAPVAVIGDWQLLSLPLP